MPFYGGAYVLCGLCVPPVLCHLLCGGGILALKKRLILTGVLLFFVAVNLFLWFTVTRRCANNFSGATQLKMIDVGSYLPFEPDAKLARTGASLKLTQDLPKLDGAAALVPVYASVIENVYPQGCVTFQGGVFDDNNYYGENFAEDSAMQYQNTVRGFNAVVDGKTDLFFTAYPSPDQLKSAEEKNVELEIVPIGREGFVFFVNIKNPVNNLTLEEIRKIYGGEITNWKEVDGKDLPIDPLLRVAGSGSQTTMDRVMGEQAYGAKSPYALLGGSIAYSFRIYLTNIVANDKVKMLSVNGIYPDNDSIKDGTYPLATQFYVVYRKDNANDNVRRLVDWLCSEEGQKMIEATGYAGL